MKTSVVLSTYNGEKYLVEQLDSIKNQTLSADEVVICDDCSNDNTVEIVRKYIKENGLNTWHLYINKYNKGYIKNFLDGADIATGDLLFYSDQDDIWDCHKIEYMVEAIDKNNALAIYCLMNTIDSLGRIRDNQIDKINRIPIKEIVQSVSLCQKLKYARSSGLCLAFRKEILKEVKKIASDYDLPHDIPVGTVAAVKGRYYVINKALVNHRIHFNNASSPDIKISNSFKNMDKQIISRNMKLKELEAIRDIYKETLSKTELKKLERAIEITYAIISDLKSGKVKSICYAILENNDMLNRKFAVRNLLAVLYVKVKGRKLNC